MGKTAIISVRTNDEKKKEFENVVSNLGMTSSEAINIFMYQTVAHRGIPFEIKLIANDETVKAIKSAKKGENLSKAYDDMHELWDDLNA